MSDVLAAKGDKESRILYQAKAIEALPSVQQQTPIQEVQTRRPLTASKPSTTRKSNHELSRELRFRRVKPWQLSPGVSAWAALQIPMRQQTFTNLRLPTMTRSKRRLHRPRRR